MSHDNERVRPTEQKRQASPANTLQGWPGYRTRPGRSGLDPLDSRAEAGHMGGVFLRSLLTGSLWAKNPLVLMVLCIFGLAFLVPFAISVADAFQGSFLPLGGWIATTLLGLLGVALLISLARNIIRLL